MKLCKNCHWLKTQVVDVMVAPGRTAPQTMPVCTHEECSHPVYGEPIPCQDARREQVFCGFIAKYYKPKETSSEKPLIQIK